MRTGYHSVWSGGSAMVWYWDQDKIAAAREALGRLPARRSRRGSGSCRRPCSTRARPTACTCSPAGRVSSSSTGGQTLLVDALWYPGRPSPRQVGGFLGRRRGEAREPPPDRVPEAPEAGVGPEPWSTSLTPAEWLEANERPLVAAALLVLLLAVVWQEARIFKVRHLEAAATAELARMEDRLAPLLEARSELLRLRRTNRALSALLGTPSQARLMELVDRALPNAGAEFREWRYQRGELTVVVEDPDPDPIAYVRALEAEPLFEQVRAEPLPRRERPARDHPEGAGVRALRRALRPLAAELDANAAPALGRVADTRHPVLVYGILVQSDRRRGRPPPSTPPQLGRLAKAEQPARRARTGPRCSKPSARCPPGARVEVLALRDRGPRPGPAPGCDCGGDRRRSPFAKTPASAPESSQPLPDLPGVWRVQTRLDARLPAEGSSWSALHALATHPQKLIVDRLDLRRRDRRQSSHLVLILSAYFVGVEAGQG